MPSKDLKIPQIPYFMQDVEVNEITLGDKKLLEFKIDMFPIELYIVCKDFKISHTGETENMKQKISTATDPKILSLFINDHNWDNGFDIPQTVLDNAACDLGIALQIFYLADGYSFLIDKSDDKNNENWYTFVSGLHDSIISGKYPKGTISFNVPLTKVQIYKLKGNLSKEEDVFIRDIE